MYRWNRIVGDGCSLTQCSVVFRAFLGLFICATAYHVRTSCPCCVRYTQVCVFDTCILIKWICRSRSLLHKDSNCTAFLGTREVVKTLSKSAMMGDGTSATHDRLPGEYNELSGPCSCSCLLYTSPSPRDLSTSRMPSSA